MNNPGSLTVAKRGTRETVITRTFDAARTRVFDAFDQTGDSCSVLCMHILTGVHQVEAEVAAGRLRSVGISAQVVRDNEALLGAAGSSSLGTFSVAIADSDAAEAGRALKLRPTATREAVDRDAGTGVFAAIARLLGRSSRK